MPSWTNALRTHYRWIIVAAGGVLGCVAIGGLFSLPVFLRPIAQDTGWSTTGISTAMTLAFVTLAMGMAPMTMSPLAAAGAPPGAAR